MLIVTRENQNSCRSNYFVALLEEQPSELLAQSRDNMFESIVKKKKKKKFVCVLFLILLLGFFVWYLIWDTSLTVP